MIDHPRWISWSAHYGDRVFTAALPEENEGKYASVSVFAIVFARVVYLLFDYLSSQLDTYRFFFEYLISTHVSASNNVCKIFLAN